MLPEDATEKAILLEVYRSLDRARDRDDERHRILDERIEFIGRQTSEIHAMVAGLPCHAHEIALEELKKGAGRGISVTIPAPSWSTVAKWGIAAAAGLGIVAASARQQIEQLMALLAGGKGG